MTGASQVSTGTGSRALRVPATLDALAAGGLDSLATFAWPGPFADVVGPLAAAYRCYLDAAVRLGDPDCRNLVLLGRPMMPVLTLVQLAIWTEAGRATGCRLVGGPWLDYLADADAGAALPPQPEAIGLEAPLLGWLWPRRLARTRSWTAPWRLPRAMLRPDALALTHNSLLRTSLASSRDAVRNAYEADFDLRNVPSDPGYQRRVDPMQLADHMADQLADAAGVGSDMRGKLRRAFQPILRRSYGDAAGVMSRLRGLPGVPARLYTGTGSKWMPRALGLEVMRRGGEAIRFDHGGSSVLLDTPASLAVNELSVSTRFVVTSGPAAASSNLLRARQRALPLADCAIDGRSGDPGLDVGRAAFRSVLRSGRRRVMYVPTVYYGLHQVSPPIVPAPLYIDWQLRLVHLIGSLPVDLIMKAHPEGLRPAPDIDPARRAVVATERFEIAVQDADILVYDFPATTTLAVGLCTDRPIVLIDHGTMRFAESMQAAIRARCRIVPVTSDSRNRLVVDAAELEDAVCGGPDRADPSFFRQLFLGEA